MKSYTDTEQERIANREKEYERKKNTHIGKWLDSEYSHKCRWLQVLWSIAFTMWTLRIRMRWKNEHREKNENELNLKKKTATTFQIKASFWNSSLDSCYFKTTDCRQLAALWICIYAFNWTCSSFVAFIYILFFFHLLFFHFYYFSHFWSARTHFSHFLFLFSTLCFVLGVVFVYILTLEFWLILLGNGKVFRVVQVKTNHHNNKENVYKYLCIM